jgi:mono/diheme cytochrome c family protein
MRVILEGGPTASTQPKRVVMPAFAHRLNDAEIADVTNYLRHSWGNQALPIPAAAVTALRHELKE